NTSAVGGNLTFAPSPSVSFFNMLQNFGVMTAASGDLIFAPAPFSLIVNNGTIQTGGGNIQLQLSGSQLLSNTLTVGDGRTLSLVGAGTIVNSGTVSLTSTGNPTTLQLSGSGATFSLDGTGTYQLAGAGISGVSGSEKLIDGSQTTIQGNGVISHLSSFTNTGTLRPSGGPLVIAADVGSFSNKGSIVIDAGASMTVLAPLGTGQFGGVTGNYDIGGTLQVAGPIAAFDQSFSNMRLSGAGAIVDPLGANAIANISTLPYQFFMDNHASLTLTSPFVSGIKVSLDGGSTFNVTNGLAANQLTLDGGSTASIGNLFAVSMNLSGGSNLNVVNGFSGSLRLVESGGGNQFRAPGLFGAYWGHTDLNIGAGDLADFRTTSGPMVDTFNALSGGMYLLYDGGTQTIAGALRYDGSAQPNGADILTIGGDRAIHSFTLQGAGQILYGPGAGTDALAHLQNIDTAVIFDSLTSPRTITPLSGTLRIGVDFSGEFDLLGGTQLTIQGDMKTSAQSTFDSAASNLNVLGGSKLIVTGNFINEGDTVIGAGSELDAANYFQNAGFTQNDGLLKGNLVLAGGAFKGKGTLQGEFQQTGGTFSPGDSPGTLQINGDYIQLAGTLVIEFGPSNADRLMATGDIELDGLLQFMLAGYQPHLGDKFDILDFRYIRLGPAFQFSGRTLGNGLFLNIGWGLHDMEVTVGNSLLPVPPAPQTPEPGTFVAIGGGLIAIAARIRRK
ncbi:MAG TPA: PEP-CTERM sorting domain-containing protein, partial [Candidatus Solibacter sp.]|nr:PEP-CTERM sorting domain-containing protein [Candidatus Solibacter sp.]